MWILSAGVSNGQDTEAHSSSSSRCTSEELQGKIVFTSIKKFHINQFFFWYLTISPSNLPQQELQLAYYSLYFTPSTAPTCFQDTSHHSECAAVCFQVVISTDRPGQCTQQKPNKKEIQQGWSTFPTADWGSHKDASTGWNGLWEPAGDFQWPVCFKHVKQQLCNSSPREGWKLSAIFLYNQSFLSA